MSYHLFGIDIKVPLLLRIGEKLSWKDVNIDVTINIEGTGGCVSKKVRKVKENSIEMEDP